MTSSSLLRRASRRILILAPFAVAALAATAACRKGETATPPPAPPEVVVAAAVQQDVPVYGEWIGTTAGNVNADIRPKVEGYLLRRSYPEGSYVRQGQLLFEIDPRQFQAQLNQATANLGQGKAALDKAERDVARARPLAAERALSQQELDNAVSAEQAAKANVAALEAAVEQARLNRSWTRVASPIGGIAGNAVQQVGDLVNPQTILATVSTVDPLRVQWNISEQEYLRLHGKGAATADLTLVLSDGSVFPQKGRELFAGREVDPKTGTIAVVGLFPNPGNLLRPGQYAKIRSLVGVKKQAVLVPQRAVNELQGAFQVAVVGADGKATVRTVEAAEKVGSLWVIDKGVAPGDRVVIAGFSRVKSGNAVVAKEAPAAAAAASPSSPSSGARSAAAGS
ncbi:MAG TPA: efflux RND transporter periplasmic adaptor subunit [Thermoanaerobaculia bacterium]